MAVIEIRDVVKRFGKNTALDSVSLSIEKGEIFGLLGPNGAGKTTLINIMCGLVEKDSGSVSILGMDIGQMHRIRERINIVLGFTSIGMDMSIRELLKYYCLLYDLDNSKMRINYAAKAAGVDDRMDYLVRDLSSGFKQRVLLAKALLNDPEVLFLDEPTVGLDVEAAMKMRSLMCDLRKKGNTIILTTHNMHEVEELCDRIALISNGRIIAQGSVPEIKGLLKVDLVVEIDTSDNADLCTRLKRIKYQALVVEGVVHVKLEKELDIQRLLATLSGYPLEVYSFRLLEPTLEEAFMKLVKSHA